MASVNTKVKSLGFEKNVFQVDKVSFIASIRTWHFIISTPELNPECGSVLLTPFL